MVLFLIITKYWSTPTKHSHLRLDWQLNWEHKYIFVWYEKWNDYYWDKIFYWLLPTIVLITHNKSYKDYPRCIIQQRWNQNERVSSRSYRATNLSCLQFIKTNIHSDLEASGSHADGFTSLTMVGGAFLIWRLTDKRSKWLLAAVREVIFRIKNKMGPTIKQVDLMKRIKK